MGCCVAGAMFFACTELESILLPVFVGLILMYAESDFSVAPMQR